MTKAIVMKQVGKQMRGFQLGPIDLELEKGFVYAIVGPNGSGKSTLFRMMVDQVKPGTGTLSLLGHDSGEDPRARKQRIGYVPDVPDIHDENFTVEEITSFIRSWYPTWDHRLEGELMRRFELDGSKRLKELSKGNERRLAFIHAIAHHPELLLLDEPTSGLDPYAWRLMLEETIEYMKGGDKTVVIATHSLEEVKRIADYVIFLHYGTIAGMFEKDQLLDDWKVFWLEGQQLPSEQAPGIEDIRIESGAIRLVSSRAKETEATLRKEGISILRIQGLEFDEIFYHLLRKNK